MAENAQRVTLGPFIDDGEVIGGVLLYHFAAGTNNDLDIWDDRGKEITLENPIRADENGVFNFFAAIAIHVDDHTRASLSRIRLRVDVPAS